MSETSGRHHLDGAHALITGGGTGIGAAIAVRLGGAGARITVVGRRPEPLQKVAGGLKTAQAVPFDVTDEAEVEEGLATATGHFGPVDILVNNAGAAESSPFDRTTVGTWRAMLEVNLTGTFLVSREVLPAMVERGWGRIVVISSMAARGGLHLQAAYAASKAGLVGLAKSVALEHARHGITCNAVLPGLIETEAVAAMPAALREATIARTPARRLGRMEEVAHLIRFLVSDEAGFTNGAEIPIDGGIGLTPLTLGSVRETEGATGS